MELTICGARVGLDVAALSGPGDISPGLGAVGNAVGDGEFPEGGVDINELSPVADEFTLELLSFPTDSTMNVIDKTTVKKRSTKNATSNRRLLLGKCRKLCCPMLVVSPEPNPNRRKSVGGRSSGLT